MEGGGDTTADLGGGADGEGVLHEEVLAEGDIFIAAIEEIKACVLGKA